VGDERRIAQVDLATRRIKHIVRPRGGHGGRLTAGGGLVWVTENSGPGVMGINAVTGKVSRRFAVPGGAGYEGGIAYGARSLWLARGTDVVRVDPRSGRVLHRFPAGGAPILVAFGDSAVWTASSGSGIVRKIDPVTNSITRTQKLPGWISDLTVGGGAVWAADTPGGSVFELDENDLDVLGTSRVPDPEGIGFGGGRLWVASSEAKTVYVVTPSTLKFRALAARSEPALARFHDGFVWASAGPAPAPLPPITGPELRISMPQEFLGADPSTSIGPLDSTSSGTINEQLFYATCANLLDYSDSGGVGGTQLRPELAESMPTVSPDGRTYTFRLRHGIRFSPPSPDRPASLRQPPNAVPETVTAQTFRHTIERALSPNLGPGPPAAAFASDIVGVAAYRAGKAAHISGITARGDLLSIRLVRPAGDFLTRISMPFFCPVPTREPPVPSGLTGAIPSLGPYYVASGEGNRTVLLRNPHYTGGRPRKAERIVYTQDVQTPTAVAQVEAGHVDYLPGDFNPHSMLVPGGALDHRYGPTSIAAHRGAQRYFLEPQPGINEIAFNTRRRVFRAARLRRAVNYALDRPALAAVWGEPPADDFIPAAIAGTPRHHMYPLDGPDLRTARRLAGSARRRAVLYFCGDPANQKIADIVRANLARIAISVSIVAGGASCRSAREPARADLLISSLSSPERDPAPFVQQVLADRAYGVPLGSGRWPGETFRRHLERANELSGAARFRAYARLDAELMRAAPAAVYASWVQPDYLSPRVGCRIVQAEYHVIDLGALCVGR
jgi:ABC-type transport system substrate-binding protein